MGDLAQERRSAYHVLVTLPSPDAALSDLQAEITGGRTDRNLIVALQDFDRLRQEFSALGDVPARATSSRIQSRGRRDPPSAPQSPDEWTLNQHRRLILTQLKRAHLRQIDCR